MKIKQVMTKDVTTVSAGQTVAYAAKVMKDNNVGSLPVAENDKLVGMLTDRDIVLRVVAEDIPPSLITVKNCMSNNLKYCFQHDSVEKIAKNMAELNHHRLPVVTKQKELVGVVSLSDIAKADNTKSPTLDAIRSFGACPAVLTLALFLSPGSAHSMNKQYVTTGPIAGIDVFAREYDSVLPGEVDFNTEQMAEVEKIQKALNDWGNYELTVDGVLGHRTVSALKDFQMIHGLAITGMINEETKTLLELDEPQMGADAWPEDGFIEEQTDPSEEVVNKREQMY